MDRDEELEKILAEFGPPVSPQEPERAAEKETGPSPAAEEPPKKAAQAEKAKRAKPEKGAKGKPEPEKGAELPAMETRTPPDNVIDFPQPDTSLTGRIGKLFEKADAYAEQLFPADDLPDDPERERREQLLPGVDWEEEPTHVPPSRKRRRERRPKPDIPPMQLAARYKKGLGFLHTRTVLALVLALVQLYWALALPRGWPVPLPLTEPLRAVLYDGNLRYQIAAALLGLSALVAADVLIQGLASLIKLRMEWETMLLLTVIAAVGDALTMSMFGGRGGEMPY